MPHCCYLFVSTAYVSTCFCTSVTKKLKRIEIFKLSGLETIVAYNLVVFISDIEVRSAPQFHMRRLRSRFERGVQVQKSLRKQRRKIEKVSQLVLHKKHQRQSRLWVDSSYPRSSVKFRI